MFKTVLPMCHLQIGINWSPYKMDEWRIVIDGFWVIDILLDIMSPLICQGSTYIENKSCRDI
jgi:hypothetical protein